MEAVMQMISGYNNKLNTWNWTKFGHVQHKLHQANTKLHHLLEKDPTCENIDEHNVARREV